jgi:hypothetical protein
MTALPLRDFTAAEQDRLDAIEAAPAAAESAREVVAEAMWEAVRDDTPWNRLGARSQDRCRTAADAAIAVLSGPSSDAEQAVERVLALADEHAECCEFVAVGDLRRALAGD